MNDLFKKLNVLVRASINEVLGDEHAVGQSRRQPLTPDKLGKDIDREITTLRSRINDALAFEDGLQQRVTSLQDEVSRWDRQADEAVVAGNDALARRAVEQMQLAQQRLAMAEADLREHQLVTQELIQRVNMLEAVVADARRAQAEKPSVEVDTAEEAPSAQVTPRLPSLSDVLRDAQEKINRMGDMINAQTEVTAPSPVEEAQQAADEQHVQDDLAARRERLSKPKAP